jgi:malonate-semialdehyde dehydrogenase (acetylating)/methylmalonate-semialdehyde dehydrogenase
VHGTAPTVNRILDHPDIRAVAFVGSNAAGRHVLERGTAHGKRIQVRGCTFQGPRLHPRQLRSCT